MAGSLQPTVKGKMASLFTMVPPLLIMAAVGMPLWPAQHITCHLVCQQNFRLCDWQTEVPLHCFGCNMCWSRFSPSLRYRQYWATVPLGMLPRGMRLPPAACSRRRAATVSRDTCGLLKEAAAVRSVWLLLLSASAPDCSSQTHGSHALKENPDTAASHLE